MMFPKPEPRYKEKRRSLGKRKEPRRSGRERDPAYMARVKTLPCYFAKGPVWVTGICQGVTEADHAGPRPLGRKCHDHETIPLCQKHHRDRTDYVGFFVEFTATDMRQWCDRRIAETRTRLGWKGQS